MKKNLLLLAFSTLFSLLLLEAALGVGSRLGLFPIRSPTYSVTQALNPVFWHDVSPDFGVWHPPNTSTRHSTGCFDVIYRTNSHGARDAERTPQSERRRIVVLGDSMTEGWGVVEAERYSNVLERETGIEHLNFGTAGYFGTTQYYLLYKSLASRFSHSAVLIGMLPANDFWDNDYEYGKWLHANRYRPYLVGEYPNYRLIYHRGSLAESTYRERKTWLDLGRRFLAEFTYSYNAFSHFRQVVAAWQNPAAASDRQARERERKELRHRQDLSESYSGYYDFRKDQLDLVKYTFEEIKRLAGKRDVIIVLLPARADLRRYDPAVVPPLSAELEQFAAASGIKFVDLLPEMHRHSKNGDSLFPDCDNHWSALGHEVAARSIRKQLASLYRGLTQ